MNVTQSIPVPPSDRQSILDQAAIAFEAEVRARQGNPCKVIIDYMAMTFPYDVEVACIIDLFGKEGWEKMKHGMKRYPGGVKRGNGNILWNPDYEAMGIHAVFSGEGCRELEALGIVGEEGGSAKHPWREYLGLMRQLGAKFTRVDLAIDDFSGLITRERIEDCVNEGLTCTRSNKFSVIEGDWDLHAREREPGWTLNFGKRVSEGFIRVYGKTEEQQKKYADRGQDAGDIPEKWVRVEAEFKRERACSVVDRIVENGLSVVPQIILSYLDFKEVGKSKRNTRLQTAWWWAEVLGTVEKLSLSTAPISRSIGRCMAWLEKQVAPVLSLIVSAEEGSYDWFEILLEKGMGRQADWHKELLRAVELKRAAARQAMQDIRGVVWEQGSLLSGEKVVQPPHFFTNKEGETWVRLQSASAT